MQHKPTKFEKVAAWELMRPLDPMEMATHAAPAAAQVPDAQEIIRNIKVIERRMFEKEPYPTLARITHMIQRNIPRAACAEMMLDPQDEADFLREMKADWEEKCAATRARGEEPTPLVVEEEYRAGRIFVCGVRVLPPSK